ncbi:MAG: hypothetical protein WDZ93_01625 [Candidatus Paceibacterota bacterium]
MDYQYFYLVWTLFFLIIWLSLFLLRKDSRREILAISLVFGVGGIGCQYLHLHDWWQPLRITNTSVGFEDFFIGFAIGGIASVLYEVVAKRRDVHPSNREAIRRSSYFFIAFFALVFVCAFFMLHLNSMSAALLAYVVGISYLLFRRRDLLVNSIVSGTLLLVLGAGTYWFLFLIYPEYISLFWHLPEVWYSKLIFGIPIGEYIWYFLTGAFIGPLYEFIEGLRTRKLPNV